jgi:HEAT repeat protein
VDQQVITLLKQLKDPDESVRLKAAKALGKLGVDGKPAIPALEEAAKDKDDDVRAMASKSLAAIRKALGQDDNDKGGPPEKLANLIKDLKDPSAEKRMQAVDRIGATGADGIIASEALIQLLVEEKVEANQHAALDALEKVNPQLHKPILIIMVEKDPDSKAQAVDSLGELGKVAKPAVPLLLKYYASLTGKDRRRLDIAPGELGHFSFKETALIALRQIDGESEAFHDLLLNAVSEDMSRGPLGQTNFRPSAILMVVLAIKENKLDAKRATKALMSAMNDRQMQILAIQQIGLIGPDAKEAIPVLMKLKFDPDMMTREAAIDALKKIQ